MDDVLDEILSNNKLIKIPFLIFSSKEITRSNAKNVIKSLSFWYLLCLILILSLVINLHNGYKQDGLNYRERAKELVQKVGIQELNTDLVIEVLDAPKFNHNWIKKGGIFSAFILIIILPVVFLTKLKKGLQKEDDILRLSSMSASMIRELFLERYQLSQNFLHKELSKYDKHSEFIDKFYPCGQNSNGKALLKKQKLTEVYNKAKESNGYGKFLCVLSNPEYYKVDPSGISKQTKDLIDYFLSFKSVIEKNTIIRIFSAPKGTGSFKYDDKILLQYLIINEIIGIKTYLLKYNNAKAVENKYSFSPNIDYVLSERINENMESENVLFFSYIDDENDDDQVLETNDVFFVKIIESDFTHRLQFQAAKPTSDCLCVKISKEYDMRKLLSLLNLTPPQAIDAIDEIINNLADIIRHPNKVTIRKKLENSTKVELNKWKKRFEKI